MPGARVLCCVLLFVVTCACADTNHTQEQTEALPFSCVGRPPGYYADIASDCQRYHLCDGGRKFTHSCPDMTRFQQRMMVCDHWYSVDCSDSEGDFGANLLIGRRDKPFLDHPRPRSGRRRVLHRGRPLVTTTTRQPPPEEPSTTAETRAPRITFRYVEATTPGDKATTKQPSIARVHFGTARQLPPPQDVTQTSPRDFVEVRISDPRLMFFIPGGSGEDNDLGTGGNSTVVIHLDHRHSAMRFRPGGRTLPGGRNPQCPDCLPAFLAPGSCQPCVTIR